MSQIDPNAATPSESLTGRYLDLVKRAVLDELYLENELRIEYLLEQIENGRAVDVERLRDPIRNMRVRATRLLAERLSGSHGADDSPAGQFAMTAVGRSRLDHIEACLRRTRDESLAGDLFECGTDRGGVGVFMRAALEALGLEGRRLWVADEFRAWPNGTADLNDVRDSFHRLDLLDDSVHFVQGGYAATLGEVPVEQIALLHIGARGNDVRTILDALYPRVVAGGFVIVDDHASAETAEAVSGFRAQHASTEPMQRIDWSGVSWRKADPARPMPTTTRPPPTGFRLSVVVVFYNMRREAARTLHSLSRSYQTGLDDVDYEVVVVENGSAAEQRLNAEYVSSFGDQFRYIDMGEDASPSPVKALNAGIAASTGRAVALMIDGAHVLTPGVLHFGLLGLTTYARSIVATQQWYVGPGQQPDAVSAGYDQQYEDQLFDDIQWPSDGYRLFDIGHFVGDRDWLDGLWESNCLFVPRELLEQSGSFDESFSMPGGGYANLELYERLGSTPGVASVTILGEGSFHQAHGGTTTNQPKVDARHGELAAYSDHFEDTRGKKYSGHGKFTHYVGTMRPNTMRSRSRRRTAPTFFKPKDASGIDGIPQRPWPMPQDLATEFTEAFWNSLAWKRSSWLGWRTRKTPTDLFAYQEVLVRIRPDWIIETGPGSGGRTLFLASICELMGHGTVISIDAKGPHDRPEHPRITWVTGVAHEETTARVVRDLVGPDPHAFVLLGGWGSRQRALAEFDLYAPLVRVGSYVVIEDTILNGHPVWPGFGSGPMEAVKGITNQRASFASDHDLEKYGLTFNPNGFLKRVR